MSDAAASETGFSNAWRHRLYPFEPHSKAGPRVDGTLPCASDVHFERRFGSASSYLSWNANADANRMNWDSFYAIKTR